MKSRTRSRKPASIGSNHSSRRPTAFSPSEPRTGNFVLLLVMAWSPPAHNAGIVGVSAPGDYATFNSNHTPDATNGKRSTYVARKIDDWMDGVIKDPNLAPNHSFRHYLKSQLLDRDVQEDRKS